MLAIEASGARVAYRKRFLGGAEPAHFSPGPGPVVLEVDGWRLGLAICKDTGAARHAADVAALGMDLYVAAVLEAADDAHVQEERALRVIRDYGVWVAVASFAGSAGGSYDRAAGGSAIWGREGDAVVRAGKEPGEVVGTSLA